jgi:protein-S-isoprenylcysteine O-methyltransferase Ste14
VRSVELQLRDPLHLIGLALVMIGGVLLLWCIVEFARRGRGTLSPMDPPRALVVHGLYRFVRNPMYASVAALLMGEVALTRSSALLLYAITWFVWVNVFVILYEEPMLRRDFGADYDDYTRRVGRWLPRRDALKGFGR